MFRTKNFWKYFLIVFILILAVIIAGCTIRKSRLAPFEEKNINKKSAETETPKETLPAVGQSNLIQAGDNAQENDSVGQGVDKVAIEDNKYFVHKNITVTYFWVGEGASEDNGDIANSSSAWDEKWVKHFGGVDNPKKRNGFFPAGFTPKENPFYFALPYNDFNSSGERKQEIYALLPWAKEKKWGESESVCKNRWIKIVKGGKAAYAQWQDVGPFKEDDKNYVFGKSLPKSKTNNNAGLDVSPAVKTYLGLSDIGKIDWQFVDSSTVPDGPWKKIITISQIYWK
jgi:hypothetical protein